MMSIEYDIDLFVSDFEKSLIQVSEIFGRDKYYIRSLSYWCD